MIYTPEPQSYDDYLDEQELKMIEDEARDLEANSWKEEYELVEVIK